MYQFRTRSRQARWLLAAYALMWPFMALAEGPPPMHDVRVPLEWYEDGTVRRQLTAGTAVMSPGGAVSAQDVRVESFDPTGRVEMVLVAATCEYDRQKGIARSKDDVAVSARGIELTGVGYEWNIASQEIKVLSNVRLEFNRTSRTNRTNKVKRRKKK